MRPYLHRSSPATFSKRRADVNWDTMRCACFLDLQVANSAEMKELDDALVYGLFCFFDFWLFCSLDEGPGTRRL